MLTRDEVADKLNYDPDTGVLTWNENAFRKVRGKVAGSKNSDGYLHILFARKRYLVHRLAWLLTYGTWPRDQIDHINGDRMDNRISNLREVTNQENHWNQTRSRGYRWHEQAQKWHAQIQANGKKKYLGLFDTEEDARAAYLTAKEKLHRIETYANAT